MKNITGMSLSQNERLTINVTGSKMTVNSGSVNDSRTTSTDHGHDEGAFASGFFLPGDDD